MEGLHPREVYFSWGDLVEGPHTEEIYFSLGDIVGDPNPQELYFSCADIVAYRGAEPSNLSTQIQQNNSKSTGYSFYSANSNRALLESDVDNSQYDETESNLSTGLGSTNTSICLSGICDHDDSEDETSFHGNGTPRHEILNDHLASINSSSVDALPTKYPKLVKRAEDDTSAHLQPPGHVDYLSYEWREEEIWASRKYVMSMRDRYSNLGRLDNALWRSWEKTRSQLKVVAPENLNWLKDGDVTWLYGPLQPVLDKPLEDLFRTDGYGQISTPRCALKKKPTLTKWRLSEIMLHKSLSAFSLLKQAAAAVHFEPSTQDTTPGPTVLPIPPRPMYKYTDGILPLLLSSGISAAREKSVRFHDQVEQFIAIDTTNDENYVVGSGSDKSAIDWDSDNNSDILEMRLKRPKFGPLSSVYETTKGGRTRKRRSKRVTIQKLPPTPLKLRSDPLETFLAARNKDRFRDFTWLRPFPLRETLLSAETLTCRRFGDNNNDKGQYIKCHSVNLPSLSDERRSEIEAWALNHLELSESKSPVTVSDADRCDITCCADREQHMGFVESLEDRDTWDNKMSIDPRRASELFENALRIVDDSERSEDFLEVCYDNLLEPLSPEERTQMLCSYPDNLSQISSNMVDSPNSITLMGAVDTLAARRSRQRKVALLKDISVDRPQNALGSHTSPVSSTPPAVAREIHMPERSLPAEGLQEIMIVTIEEHRKSELADIDPQSGTIEAGSSSPNISQYQTSESEGIGSDFSANNDHCDRIDDMYGDPENVLEEVLDPMRQTIVDRVMNEFWVLFNQTWSANITQHTGNSATVLSPSMGGMPATSQKSSGTTQRKRQRSEDEEPPDESNDKRPQQPGKGLCEGSDSGDRPRFACPFRKHNPRRYGVHSHSVCALSSWETIARVKEHLYRCHQMALYCKRCLQIFKTQQQLDAHIMVATAVVCDVVSGNPPEGVTPENEKKLKSKKKSHPNQTDEDRWRDIYRLLFPSEDVPSPYLEPVREDSAPLSPNSRELANYEDYIRRELPRMVRANIEELVRQQMQPFEASLIGSVVGIIQDCQDRVFRAYREGICDDEDVHMSPSIDMETDASLPPSEVVYTGMQSNQNQYQSSHFLDAVFQHPPPLKSAGQCPSPLCAVDQLHTSTQSTTDTVLSDSGYASEQLCNCLGPCICLARTISSQSQEATAVESQRIDARDEDFQWHDWIDNLGWNHMDEMDGEDRNEANAID